MGGFVQGVEGEPTAGMFNRRFVFFAVGFGGDDAFEHGGELFAEGFGLEELPFVKAGTVAQGKAVEKVAAIEFAGAVQGGVIRPGGEGAKFQDVHIHLVRRESDGLAFNFQHVLAERGVERGEGAAERGTGAGRIGVGIKEGCQLVALVCGAGQDEVGSERNGFAGVEGKRSAVFFEPRRAEKVEIEHVAERGAIMNGEAGNVKNVSRIV